ncbi:MAG: HAD family hydrolase [Phycisphaerales bacterium]|nr:HAD family hydrolase [Phycisphaerales bacterium]
MRYKLIAIDLDGTLLDARSKVPARNRDALHRAHEAGLKIVLCTGRSYTETRPVIDQIGLDLDATVTVGGALITDVARNRTIEAHGIEQEVAAEALDWFRARGYAVLWLHDAAAAGFDGYTIAGPRRHPAIDRWLALTPCRMREIDSPPGFDHAPLRLTVIDEAHELESLAADFHPAFMERMTHNIIDVPAYGFTVIESFAARVDKWTGIQRLCNRWKIDPAATAAIGDDVNDIPMLRSAGLGVAVANARPGVIEISRRVVGSNQDGGVADLLESILED